MSDVASKPYLVVHVNETQLSWQFYFCCSSEFIQLQLALTVLCRSMLPFETWQMCAGTLLTLLLGLGTKYSPEIQRLFPKINYDYSACLASVGCLPNRYHYCTSNNTLMIASFAVGTKPPYCRDKKN